MNYQELIPERLDVFAFIIFLGVVQGLFFSYFLIVKSKSDPLQGRLLGVYLLQLSLTVLEIFLCYTGYIVHVLWLVDFSEPTNFLGAPLLYYLVYHARYKRLPKKWHLHMLPFVFYSLYMIPFFVQGADFKFNAYIDSYHPQLEKLAYNGQIPFDILGIKPWINPISVIFSGSYMLATLSILFRGDSTPEHKANRGPRWLKTLVVLAVISYLHWTFRAVSGIRDLQDHLVASFLTLIIYFVAYRLISERFRQRSNEVQSKPKYAKSALSETQKAEIETKLLGYFKKEQYYLSNMASLEDLSGKINTNRHYVSQVLNEKLNMTFLEMLRSYRIVAAKEILRHEPDLKIELLANQVGYNSKSAFNTAFRNETGMTPSEFRSGPSASS